MKIAIVAPSPVPFTIGGMENLAWGLCESINKMTKHQAELIKMPSRENSFWDIIDSYYAFYKLDLSYFDLVISTKYPSWMISHKNHTCYTIHRLRGFYDTWHSMNMPSNVTRGNKKIDVLLDYMKNNTNVDSLDDFFEHLYTLKNDCQDIPVEVFSFPGSFIRKIVIFLDNFGMSKNRVKKYFCISKTVANRKEYFPDNVKAEVVYPPSNLKEYSSGEYNHIFMVSRLDNAKRIDLLIKSMQYVKSDIKLYIAGTGPQENELKQLAASDHRIEFLGFVNDDTVEEYYKNSLVIPYFPYDEDYGLITIEAMMHKKPVITTVDAGGPTEFVKNNETGFVVKFDAKSIAEKIEFFAQNKDEAKRMGKNAFNIVKKISWESLLASLLDEKILPVSNINDSIPNKKKVTVTSTFPIYPPQGGGQARIFNIYRNIAKKYDVEITTLTNDGTDSFNGYIDEGLYEKRVCKSIKHGEEEWEIEKKVGTVITDVAMPLLIKYTPEYLKALEKSITDSEIVVFSQPYMWTAAKPFIKGKRLIYDAQNVESNMKKDMLPNNKASKELIELTYNIEKECCEESEFIITCSEEDKQELARLYKIPLDKLLVVPNGVDTSKTKFISIKDRLNNKKTERITNEKIALFMGSWHGPNLDACEEILKIAKKCTDVTFLLMGSQCQYFKDKKIPTNVGLLGLVSDEEKNRIFGLVDFALNPMMSGSGTNLKMFDYMAAGIPIITTEFGTRGIENKDVFIISEISDMAEEILKFDLFNNEKIVKDARKLVEEVFDWEKIADVFLDRLYI